MSPPPSNSNLMVKPGDLNIANIDLYASEEFAGLPVSLLNVFQEIHIFEDSQRSFVYGFVTVIDSLNIFNKLPIVGEETIHMKFNTKGSDEKIELECQVYKVTDRRRESQNSQVYALHFISKEYMTGIQTPISRSYKDLKPEEIAESLYDEYIKYEDYQIIPEKPLNIETFLDKQWVVFPAWTPERCMNYIAGKSVSEEYVKGEPVVFFEDRRGFNMKTIRKLVWDEGITPNDEGVMENLYYSNATNAPGWSESPDVVSLRIQHFDIVSSTNIADRIRNGYYKNKTINVDWERNKFEEKDYHIVQDYETGGEGDGDVKRITERQNPFNTETYMSDIKRDSHVRLISSRYGQKEDGGIAGRTEETYDWNKFEHISNRIHREFMGIVVEATVAGNTVRKLFDVVNVHYYEPDATATKKDKYLSGKYYINAIHHMITSDYYEHTIELVKDTLENPLERE
jgi:hypothetical protein